GLSTLGSFRSRCRAHDVINVQYLKPDHATSFPDRETPPQPDLHLFNASVRNALNDVGIHCDASTHTPRSCSDRSSSFLLIPAKRVLTLPIERDTDFKDNANITEQSSVHQMGDREPTPMVRPLDPRLYSTGHITRTPIGGVAPLDSSLESEGSCAFANTPFAVLFAFFARGGSGSPQ
ncbi:hypothetical protein B9479_006630, partial [Cryptococcus floricola]